MSANLKSRSRDSRIWACENTGGGVEWTGGMGGMGGVFD